MAEAHPVGFRWVMKAKERGATIIHVDPQVFAHERAGRYLGADPRRRRHRVSWRNHPAHHREQSVLPRLRRSLHQCLLHFARRFSRHRRRRDRLFLRLERTATRYDKETWDYEGDRDLSFPERDLTLQDPRCVFQTLRRHFARYTPEMVEKICGISPALFHKVADALVRASGPDKTAAICYALGWTQHSKGVQIIRTASILQLLLGNIGRPGGGILALRGHASIQGSTDIPTLYDILPGYLPMPRGDGSEETLHDYLAHQTKPTGLWNNFPAYFISLMKAYYGKNATAENDFGYGWVPKITGNHSFFEYLYDMADGKMEGMFMMGQNPAVGRRQFTLPTNVARETQMACRARHGRDRGARRFGATRPRSSAAN